MCVCVCVCVCVYVCVCWVVSVLGWVREAGVVVGVSAAVSRRESPQQWKKGEAIAPRTSAELSLPERAPRVFRCYRTGVCVCVCV